MLSINDIVLTDNNYHETVMGGLFLENMFLIMTIIYAVFAVALFFNARDIKKYIPNIEKRTLIILILIFSAGLILRNTEYSFGHGFDGIHYTESARTWMTTGLFVKGCGVGDISECGFYLDVLFPAGFPYLIILLYGAFGINTLSVMILNGLIGSINILLVFLIARKLFGRENIALYSALVFCLVPIDIMISPTSAVRTPSLFMIALSTIFFLMATDNDRLRNWLLFAATFSLSIYFRQENSLLLLPLSFLFFFRYSGSRSEFLCSSRFILPLSLIIATQIPVQHWIIITGGISPPGMPDFSIEYFLLHLPMTSSTLFFPSFVGRVFSPLASLFFMASIYFLFREEKNKALFLWVWFLSFFVLYTSYFYCPTLDCPEYPRYMSALSIPYSILAGMTLSRLSEKLEVKRERMIPAVFVALLLTSGLSWPAGLFMDARLQGPHTGDMIKAVSMVPGNCTVILPSYVAAGSDILEERRRWIDLDMIRAYEGIYAYNEAKNASCLMLIEHGHMDIEEINDRYPFVSEHLRIRPFKNAAVFRIYEAEFRG